VNDLTMHAVLLLVVGIMLVAVGVLAWRDTRYGGALLGCLGVLALAQAVLA
jgi:hypothetical protein